MYRQYAYRLQFEGLQSPERMGDCGHVNGIAKVIHGSLVYNMQNEYIYGHNIKLLIFVHLNIGSVCIQA